MRTGNNNKMEVTRDVDGVSGKSEGEEGDFERERSPGKEGGTGSPLSPGNNKLKRSLANTFELAGLTCSPRRRGRIETSILTFAPRFNRFPGLSFE